MSEERILLSKDEAIGLLSSAEQIHTFRNGSVALIGADWERDSLIDAIDKSDQIEIGGDMCRKMGHGLVVWTGDIPLFVEVDAIKIDALEKSKTK